MNDFEQAIELLRKVQELIITDDYEITDGELIDQLWALNIDKFLTRFDSYL